MKTLRELMGDRFRKGGAGRDTVTGWDFTKDERLIRSRAIRVKCFECQNGQIAEIAGCESTDCALWPWRMGVKIANKAEEPREIDVYSD